MAAPGPSPGPAPGSSTGPGSGALPGQATGPGAPVSPRQPRRGPAPFASFDHDVSDEVRPDSSPEKPTIQLPEILEHGAGEGESGGLAVSAVGRARSASTPGGALQATPRIDISRASSSSHHDSRDSSPEMALFAGEPPARLEAAFREDAQDLRSSTEELAFLEPVPPPPPPATAPPPRHHSRKDSQGSEVALLVAAGRSSRLSSIGSQCSALSGYSRTSRLSVASGASRSPSPHKMLLETSFCGPKPIDTDPELCAAAVERRLLEMALPPAPIAPPRPQVRAEVTVEPPPTARSAPTVTTSIPASAAPVPTPTAATIVVPDEDKRRKETRNRRARSRERRDDSRDKPEVYRAGNRSKDIIRIKLRPDDESEDREDEEEEEPPPKPASLELRATPRSRESRTPSPAPGAHSRKSSFCSLFKSRETIASPESPAGRARKRSPDRSRSKSRERTSSRGSVLSLFRGARRSRPASPAERAEPAASAPPVAPPSLPPPPGAERMPYYAPAAVIHIPLRTPPDQPADQPHDRPAAPRSVPGAPLTRTVLPDGSIIIPLHSPTERVPPSSPPGPVLTASTTPAPAPALLVHAQVEPAPAHCPPEPTIVKQEEISIIESAPETARVPPITSTPSTQTSNTYTSSASPPIGQTPSKIGSPPEPTSPRARRSRLVFSTQVGSREQVFCTQFSVGSTPGDSGLGLGLSELRDTHITAEQPPPAPVPAPEPSDQAVEPFWSEGKDSSESSASSEGRLAGGVAEDAEQRGLVVQESFEEELPYVPTTLPLERPVALPMVPVRERGGLHVARVERPRPSAPPLPRAPAPAPAPATTPAPPGEKLRISLPRRPRAASAPLSSAAGATPPAVPHWIDFEELPERRAPPKRIQTLPAAAAAGAGAGEEPHYSYVEPEQCRCECHVSAKGEFESPGH